MPLSRSFRRGVKGLHRTLGLVIGVQVLIWFVTGLCFAIIPLDETKAVPEAVHEPPAPADFSGVDLSLPRIREQARGRTIESIHFVSRFGAPLVRVDLQGGGPPLLLDARGRPVPRVGRERILAEARRHLREEAPVLSSELLTGRPEGFRYDYFGEYPVWRVEFDNGRGTRFYLSPYTGAVLARRNAVKTLFDFIYQLHILGYVDRTVYGNGTLMVTSLLGIGLAASGLHLLVRHIAGLLRARSLRRSGR